MEGIPANYLGRVISKDKFRAYVYAKDGKSMLVNSWSEFEKAMESGLWFAKIEDANPKPIKENVIESVLERKELSGKKK